MQKCQVNADPGLARLLFFACRYFANEPFADFHRVEGLQGVYIATLINGSMNEENMRSVITFDKGGTWEFLQAPAFTGYGEKINCEVQLLSSCLAFFFFSFFFIQNRELWSGAVFYIQYLQEACKMIECAFNDTWNKIPYAYLPLQVPSSTPRHGGGWDYLRGVPWDIQDVSFSYWRLNHIQTLLV
jgi:hypothetical protein